MIPGNRVNHPTKASGASNRGWFRPGRHPSLDTEFRKTKTPEQIKERQSRYWRNWNLGRYGLTLGDYDRMFTEQGGLCAICSKPSIASLCVDHDHITGAVRGLLCHACNVGIGNLQTAENLERAAAYLRRPPHAP